MLLPRACRLAVPLLLTLAPVYAHAAQEGGSRPPAASTASRPPTGETVHVVGKGQTLGRIAKRYRVSVEALREANGLHAGQRIHPGLSLVIPDKDGARKAASEPAGQAVQVRDGRPGAGRKPEKGQDRGRRIAAKGHDEEPFHGPRRKGFVRLVRGDEKLEVQLLTRHGHLAPAALAGFSQILRFYPTGAKIPIDPRLAALVGQVSDHFGGHTLHVVSGFRPYSPAQYTRHSNHNVGHAMDFSVEGVPNTVLRDFCKSFRNAGVGYYPNSTFVHLDVRSGKTYWVDYSRPGEAPHYDSPSSQGAADEAAGDVEPHAGAVDQATPAAEPEPGSPATH